MAQRNAGRIDRFAQMNKQEELIAKKRQEILEKQRTTQLAKAVAAAQNLSAKLKSETETLGTDDVEEEKEKTTKKDEEVQEPPAKPSSNLVGKIKSSLGGGKRTAPPVPVAEQAPPKVQNFFCNDGSFLDHFKKILEKHEPKPPAILETAATQAAAEAALIAPENSDPLAEKPSAEQSTSPVTTTNNSIQLAQQPQFSFDSPTTRQDVKLHSQQQQQHAQVIPLQQPTPQQLQQPPPIISYAPVPPPAIQATPPASYFSTGPPQQIPPPPPPVAVTAAVSMLGLSSVANARPPPPPPPPQLPIALANMAQLYMIPAPEPMQLNAIPAPKEFDLNAIPKPPQINLEAIKMPTEQQMQKQCMPQQQQQQLDPQQIHHQRQINHQQMQQHMLQQTMHQQQQQQQHMHQHIHQQHIQQQQQLHQQQMQQQQQPQDINDQCLQIPTTVESLIALVADCGDDYEDKICSRKNDLHSSMWFLFDKSSDKYHNYRQKLNERRRNKQQQRQQQQQQQQRQQQQQQLQQQPQQQQQQHQQQHQQKQQQHQQKQQQHQQQHQPQQSQQQQPQQPQQQQQQQHEEQLQLQPPPPPLQQQPQEQLQETNSNNNASLQNEDELPCTSNQTATIADCDIYDPESVISGDIDSDDEYMRGMMDRNRDNIKRRIECRNELSEEERQEKEHQRQEKKKLRKSRWGDKVEVPEDSLSSPSSGVPNIFGNQNKPMLSTVTRSDPQLLQYARLNYGSVNLSEDDWRKCEEHFKVNLLYQDMMRKRQEIDRLARNGKFKYEYDSDEDVNGGTWEHKLRCAEMDATQAWAQALTKQSEGKHHIGDFLPPEELKKFMEQYESKKSNRQPDLSDYKEYKLKEDNIGFQMLQKLGWKEGQGLGTGGEGIVEPVNKAPQREGNQGLGIVSAATPENCDNEYDAYRKRMMLAYRFRPNPLNNPRRAYY